ncbi:MAG: proline hydroxylase, partial [Pseudomonadota bacterium]|nr:proline hydroxylase [Pseudomonadota bacterium]
MNGVAHGRNVTPHPTAIAQRVTALDWPRIGADLDLHGCAVVNALLSPEECQALVDTYAVEASFRSRVVMARHGFGRGEYKYFAYP